jgi:hypothetical protein
MPRAMQVFNNELLLSKGGERMKEEGTFDDWAEKMRIVDKNQVCPKCHWVNIPEIELHNNECISCAYPMKVVA